VAQQQNPAHLKVQDVAGASVTVKSTKPDAVAERKRQALVHLANGYSVSATADLMGIHRNTIMGWNQDDPTFRKQREQIAANRDEELSEELEETALAMARGKATKDEMPHWGAVRHMLGVTNPKRHGDKKQIEHTGTVVHSLIPRARRLEDMIDATDMIDVPMIEGGEPE
jgi:transposase